jgi:hypothetical protein
VRSTVSGCRSIDRWSFPTGRNQVVDIRLDTRSASNAADLCFKGRCGSVDVGGDDEQPCSLEPPAFGCAHTAITTRGRGACTIDVSTCSDSCATATAADYLLTVSIEGGGPAVVNVENDASETGPLCAAGENDSEPCVNAADCPGGACVALPAAPPRAVGELPPATDVPPGAGTPCSVTFVMNASVTFGTLKYKNDYETALGGFPGLGREVVCDRLVGGFSVFTDYDASKVLATTLVSSTGIAGPGSLVRCPFLTSDEGIDALDFPIAITEARAPDGTIIDPQLEAQVNCGGAVTTTTLPENTTTTLPGNTTTTLPGNTTTTAPGNTTTTAPEATTTTLPDTCETLLGKWGRLGDGPGEFNMPVAIAADESRQHVHVVDRTNARIQTFDLTGSFVREWGSSGRDPGEFSGATDVAVNGETGDVYVADTNNNRIQKFDAAGQFLAQWGSSGSGDGQFDAPVGVAVDGSGNVYVVDRDNARVQRFTGDGNFLSKFGSPGSGPGQFLSPEGIAVGDNGNIFIADSHRDRILKFSPDGTLIVEIGRSGSGPGQFTRPFDVFVEGGGDIFVVDTGRSRIQKLDSAGRFESLWGSFGRGDSQFDDPRSITGIGRGQVFVADTGNNRIQKFRCL